MRNRLLVAALLSLLSTQSVYSESIDSESNSIVLISYFQPQHGRTQNASKLVADEILRVHASSGGADHSSAFRIETCELKVSDPEASGQLKDCVSKFGTNVKLILSLGESPCRSDPGAYMPSRESDYAVELISFNPDSRELPRSRRSFLFPTPAFVCGLPEDAKKALKIRVESSSLSVCNNTSYRAAEESIIPFQFIHVPRENCLPRRRRIEDFGAWTYKGLQHAMKFIERHQERILEDHIRHQPWPRTTQGMGELLEAVIAREETYDACTREVVTKIHQEFRTRFGKRDQ